MTHDHSHDEEARWKHDGVRVIKGDQLDPNTAQTPGMFRQAAINHARVGAQKIWAGTVAIEPNAKTGVHHHGALESVIFVIRGKARMRWGERLEFVAEAGPGDFIYVPPYVPHQEINADPDQCSRMRAGALGQRGGGRQHQRRRTGRGAGDGVLGRPDPQASVRRESLLQLRGIICSFIPENAGIRRRRAVRRKEGSQPSRG